MNESNRPDWAKYRAMDRDTRWWWFEEKPWILENKWISSLESKKQKILGQKFDDEDIDWRESLYQYPVDYDTNTRIDLIGQNGNTGEHYEPAATVRDMAAPVIYTTVQALRVHHDDGHIDVMAGQDGGAMIIDQEGGETYIPSLSVMDAVRDAMARIAGE